MKRIDTVFVLIIFGIFALSVLLVLVLAGSIYGNITEVSSRGRNERLALSYVRTKIRNTDSANGIYVGNFDGVNALHLKEDFSGDTFLTRIYFYDGYVRELFHLEGLDFAPKDGVPLIEAKSLSFEERENGLIYVYTQDARLLIKRRTAH